jgi:tetratricopeptide (TPR) repeat protein
VPPEDAERLRELLARLERAVWSGKASACSRASSWTSPTACSGGASDARPAPAAPRSAPRGPAPRLAPPASAQGQAFDAGVEAYRGGDYAAASELWTEALAAPLAPAERARVCYDLGNAVWRAGRRGEALGWYSAALRAAPRHADARANLEFAREELGLSPADEGSLATAMHRAAARSRAARPRPACSRPSLLLCAALVVEALRGAGLAGAVWRSRRRCSR